MDHYRKEKAVDYYQQAVKIYNELADQEPDTYTHYVATALHNLGVLYDEKKDYPNARKTANHPAGQLPKENIKPEKKLEPEEKLNS